MLLTTETVRGTPNDLDAVRLIRTQFPISSNLSHFQQSQRKRNCRVENFKDINLS